MDVSYQTDQIQLYQYFMLSDRIEIGLNKKTYRFETEEQLKYFMMGVDEGNGWLEYEVQDD